MRARNKKEEGRIEEGEGGERGAEKGRTEEGKGGEGKKVGEKGRVRR